MSWWRRLTRMALPYGGRLAMLVFVVLAGVGLQVAQPWPVKWALDRVLVHPGDPRVPEWAGNLAGGGSPTGLLVWLAVASVLLFVLRKAADLVRSLATATIGTRMSLDSGRLLFDNLQRRSPAFHDRHPIGDLVSRINVDARAPRLLIFGVCLPFLTSLVTLVSIGLIVWRIDWIMTAIALGLTLPMGVVMYLAAGPMTRRGYDRAEQEGRVAAAAERALGAVPVVQAFVQEDSERRRFEDQAESALRANLRLLASQIRFRGGVGLVRSAGVAVVMLAGGFRALEGHLTVGDLYLCLVYVTSLYGPVETLAYLTGGIADAKNRARRMFEVLDEPDPGQVSAGSARRPLPRSGVLGRVSFEGVWFGYRPDAPVLRGIDLDVAPGETVAIVGPSGAGKTTLARLLPRFYSPWRGTVRIDGIDVRGVDLADVRRGVTWVPQEAMLLPLTVRENIAYGRPGATDEEVAAAARAANADGFIRELPQGYDTPVGERGASLSGGQAQRIAIARAVLRDAVVLILDEPTSALDPHTEAEVMRAMRHLAAGRTTFIIAHRLSTVRRADRIVVLGGGRIQETGTHEQLMAADGPYRRLVRLQNFLPDDAAMS